MARGVFRGYNRVKFQSLKLRTTIFCQSLLMRDYLLQLEWMDDIKTYQLKPLKISFEIEGIRKVVIPHVCITDINDKRTLVWINSSTNNNDARVANRNIKIISDFCAEHSLVFSLKNPTEIRKEPFLSNLKFLRRYHRYEFSLKQLDICRKFFRKYEGYSLGDLVSYLNFRNEGSEVIYALLSKKIINADIENLAICSDLKLQLNDSFNNSGNGRITL